MSELNECFICASYMDDCECGETEGYSSDEVICPYCGFGERPDGEMNVYNDGETEICCASCGKDFEVSTYISFTWTTTRINE